MRTISTPESPVATYPRTVITLLLVMGLFAPEHGATYRGIAFALAISDKSARKLVSRGVEAGIVKLVQLPDKGRVIVKLTEWGNIKLDRMRCKEGCCANES